MFNDLTALGYGLVLFAIIIGVGTLVLYNMAGSVGCDSIGNATYIFNSTANACQHSTTTGDVSNNGSTTALHGSAYTNMNYLSGQLGQSGLAGWTPAIIAISVGLLFLGAFLIGGGRRNKARY